MTPGRSGAAFTLTMFCFLGVSLFIGLIAWRGGSVQLSVFQNVLLSEAVVLLPGLFIATVCGSEVGEIFRFKKIKPGTAALVVLFTLLMEPLVTAVNAFSLLFSENAAADIADMYLNENSIYVLLVIGILGPLAEELTFRGVIYAGLRKSGRLFPAILLQAFLFGLMHLNLNQFCYSFILGILFGILDEVTLSLWPGIIGHVMINSGSVISAFAMTKYMPDITDADLSRAEIISAITFNGALALICTSIAVFVLFVIAGRETGGRFRLNRIFKSREIRIINGNGDTQVLKRPHVITVPVLIGIAIAVTEMVLSMVLQL